MSSLRVVSIEPSRRCSKACAFCYNGSSPDGAGDWELDELVRFGRDLAAHGVEVISLGGGEPLEWAPVFELLAALDGRVLRSLTTSGIPLDDPATLERLAAARPDKVHVSVHDPSRPREVERAIRRWRALEDAGLRAGVNLLCAKSKLLDARHASARLREAGIGPARVVHLPMRGADTPSPAQIAWVAAGPFQSMTCLSACGRSPRFASVGADRTAAWCSYTRTRRRLRAPTHAALSEALDGLGLQPCGGGELVRLGSSGQAPSQSARAHPASGGGADGGAGSRT